MNKEQVRKIIEGLATGADAISRGLDGNAELAAKVSGVLLRAVSGLLISRSPEEVLVMLTDMATEPAERASLDRTRSAMERIIEERKLAAALEADTKP